MTVMRFAPVIGDPIGSLMKGHAQGTAIRNDIEARRARGLEGAALQGDVGALNKLAGLDPKAYKGAVDWNSLTNTDQARLINAAATQADTPEKWASVSAKLTGAGVPGADIPFSERGKVLNESGRILGISEGRTKSAEREFAQKMQLKRAGKSETNITVGAPNISLGKAATNQVQKSNISSTEHLARLNDVRGSFDPKFQTLPFRAGMKLSEVKSKLGGDLTQQQRTDLKEFSVYKRRSLDNISRTIKDLTGAAMSIPEAQRIRATEPDPGDGIFDGDAPETFRAKMNDSIRSVTRAIARQNYLMGKGITKEPWKEMSLDEVDGLINDRGNEIYGEMKAQNPGANDADLRANTKIALEKEFGIGMGR